jgi:signal transduction histidine kinase/Tfp pilus assembly protein PilF
VGVNTDFKRYNILLVLLLGFVMSVNAQTPKLDSLNNLIRVKTGADLLNLYLEAGREYMYVAPLKSIECGEKLLSLGKELNIHTKDGMANLIMGAGYLFSGNFEKGKEYTDRGLKIARANENIEEECTGLNSLAAYYSNTGDYKQAIEIFKATLKKALAANLTDRAAMVTFNLGAIYTNQGKLTEGLNAFQEALKYFTQTSNDKYVARSLMNIAVNYHTWGNYDKALEYYQKADNYFVKLNDKVGRLASLNNIGEVYKDKENFAEAIKFYSQSLNIAVDVQSKLNEGIVKLGLAEAYLKLNNIDKAKKLAQQSLELFTPMEMLEGILRSKWILGEVEFINGNFGEALALANESARLAKKTGIPDVLVRVSLLQSKISNKTGDYKSAYAFLQNYIQLKDSLFNDQQTKRLTAMQTELDLKLKENEIVILQKENEIKDLQIKKQQSKTRYLVGGLLFFVIFSGVVLRLNRARKKAYQLLDENNKRISEQHQELIKVNETKNRFLSIIGHDLRNPVGAFSEMLGQLVDNPQMFPGELHDQVLSELRREADSTYYLLDNLLSWAKTQKENIEYSPEIVRLKSLIDNNIILNSRFSENKGIQLLAEGNYDYEVVFDQNMLNLILRNLISNALKFSFPGGIVHIKVQDEGSNVRVCVIDQGIGIEEENIPLLLDSNSHFSTFGTANEKGSGLGLILCNEFIKHDGGEMKIVSRKSEGTTICFTLRKTKSIV